MPQKYRFISSYEPYPAIDPGKMRHPISIRYRAVGSPPIFDAAGVSLSTPTTLLTAMAAAETIDGTDIVADGQTTSRLQIAFGMWYRPGIIGGMEVVRGNNVYLIQEVENMLEMDVVLILICIALGTNT